MTERSITAYFGWFVSTTAQAQWQSPVHHGPKSGVVLFIVALAIYFHSNFKCLGL